MSLLAPEVGLAAVLNFTVNQTLHIHLFSNDHTPVSGDTVSSLTEVSGGGYAVENLTFANWTVGGGAPAVAIYNSFITWTFTGATDAPGTIYGYYITTSDDLTLLWEERFSSVFTPETDAEIRIKPRITLQMA